MLVWSWRGTRGEGCGAEGNLLGWAWALCLAWAKPGLARQKLK